MLVPMRRIEVVVPRSSGPEAVRLIHRSGVMHLASFDPAKDVPLGIFRQGRAEDDGAPSAGDVGSFGEALQEVARLGGLLGPGNPDPARLEDTWALDEEGLLEAVAALRPILARAEQLTGERVRASADLGRLERYRTLIDGLARAVGRLPRLAGYAATGIIVGKRHRPLIGIIGEELESATGGCCEVIAADLPDDRSAAILLYPTQLAAEIGALLGGRDLEELTLPSDLRGVPFDELVPRMIHEVERLEAHIAGLDEEMRHLSAVHGDMVRALGLVLQDRVAEAQELKRAAGSDHLSVLAGWVPASKLAELRTALAEGLGEEALVVDHGASGPMDHDAPVAIADGPVARAFEPLARFVAVPRYGTIDPTPLLALTFPAFVGLMVGDAGYGIVLLALLLLFRRPMKRSSRLGVAWPIGLTMAVSMIAFGLLFGEVFGETGHRVLGLEPLLLDRRGAILTLLLVALTIGLAQVGLGLALGVVNATLMGHRREALGRAALLTGLLTVTLLGGWVAGLLPSELAGMAAAALVAAVVIASLAMGLAGPIEMLGIVGNVLSYARLMAVGLAGVMLAIVADRLGSLVPGVAFGLLVAVMLHALNLVLGVFDASVQGLRLHYVEFFTKFVEPGGTPYQPFESVLGTPARLVAKTGRL